MIIILVFIYYIFHIYISFNNELYFWFAFLDQVYVNMACQRVLST